jgi:Dehydrogenases with different specificities (related to short-chain alcohol dehydrogenases)
MNRLKGKKVVVTGAASGIGNAIALGFLEAGAEVVGLDLVQIEGMASLVADLRDEQTAVEAFTAPPLTGRIDVLVNAAGIYGELPLRECRLSDFDRLFAVNVRGAILAAREALKHMERGGRIINLASELAFLGREGASGYAATKGAILSLTRSWARELAPDINVNAIAPGPVDTPMLSLGSMSPEERARETSNPMGRVGRTSEIVPAALFLAGSGGDFMTGQCISVDGGAAMH